MKRLVIARLTITATVAALGLVACSSSADEASSEDVDRQAGFLIPLVTEVCLSREASAGPMNVTFTNNATSRGNGPFTLDYVQCGRSERSATPVVLRLNIADSSGTDVLYIGAANPEIGYPKMTVKSLADGTSVTHTFSDGESFTYNVGPYSVEVERQPDSEDAKSLRVWVSRP
jgi:hypothetical protein